MVAVAATLWLMIQARGVLEPLMIALLLWAILNALAGVYARLAGGPEARPGPVAKVLATLSGLAVITGVGAMTATSVAGFRANLPTYEANLRAMLEQATAAIGLMDPVDLRSLTGDLAMTDLLLGVAGSALGGLSTTIVVLVYVAFIFVEASAVPRKLRALAPNRDEHDRLAEIMTRIGDQMETFFGVKCIVGIAQALPSFLLLWWVGLDGAAFWAVVIFVSSFVPTIGSLIGIVFPTVVAIAQFADPVLVIVVVALLTTIQLAGSNWLEPKLMGQTLNLSALVIIVAIFAGGAVWGITGALVAVPALSIAGIVFSQFASTRPVAVLLSSDGRLGPDAPPQSASRAPG